MALDTEDIKLITGLQEKMEERLVNAINSQGSGTRATIEAEVNRIDEMDKIRNGRIQKTEKKIEILEDKAEKCESHVKGVSWVLKRWYVVIALMVVFGLCTSWLFHHLDVRKTVEKQIGIELKDNEDN